MAGDGGMENQGSDVHIRVAGLERSVARNEKRLDSHSTVLDEHAKQITKGRANETHLVRAVEEVKQEIKSFKNYALATMVTFIVALLGALFMLIQSTGAGTGIPPP